MPASEVERAAAALDAARALAAFHNATVPAGGTLTHLQVCPRVDTGGDDLGVTIQGVTQTGRGVTIQGVTQAGGGDNTGGDNTVGDNTGGDNTVGDNTGGDNTGGDNTGVRPPVLPSAAAPDGRFCLSEQQAKRTRAGRAPEGSTKERYFDARADVFTLGEVLWALLGSPPAWRRTDPVSESTRFARESTRFAREFTRFTRECTAD
eukprot:1186475-Prorocentrum_minimum.AAC.2